MKNVFFVLPIAFGIILIATLLFVTKKAPLPVSSYSSDSFVTAKNLQLYIGGLPYHSIGVNRYNLLTRTADGTQIGCASAFSEQEISFLFSHLHSIGVTSIRFWLFQSFTKSGEDMSRFDFVLSAAKKNNIRVIPVLENHWADCTGDMKDHEWYASGYRKPYSGYPLSLTDYIDKIVPRYKNNPTIMMWEIMNETEDKDSKTLYDFINTVSRQIKSLDVHHLISAGLNEREITAVDSEKIYSIHAVDVIDFHDYFEQESPMPDRLLESLAESKVLNKPLMVGESGIKQNISDRGDYFAKKMNAFFESGGSIYLIWSYGEEGTIDDGYNFSASDPLARIIKRMAQTF